MIDTNDGEIIEIIKINEKFQFFVFVGILFLELSSIKKWLLDISNSLALADIKIENSSNTNDFVEVDGVVTNANTWEEITVDFSAASSGVYDRLVLFPGWDVANAGTFYLDDISQQ